MSAPEAHARARFVAGGGITRLVASSHAAPLKIAKVHQGTDGAAQLCVMDSSPGIMAGDSYNLEFQLDADSRAEITTQGFARVHPSAERPAGLRQQLAVASGAHLSYVPQPMLLYSDAAIAVELNADIESGGSLFWSDIVCAGRVAHDEIWRFQSYAGRTLIRYGGEIAYCNRLRCEPARSDPGRLGAWESFTHWGTVGWFSDRITPSDVSAMHERLAELKSLRCGVSLAHRHGLIVSILGNHAWELQRAVELIKVHT